MAVITNMAPIRPSSVTHRQYGSHHQCSPHRRSHHRPCKLISKLSGEGFTCPSNRYGWLQAFRSCQGRVVQ
jgi:hypothetical protein